MPCGVPDTWRILRHVANSTTTPPRTSEYPCSRPLACSRDKDSLSLIADRGMHPWSRPAQRCWGAYVDDPTISDYRPSFSARIAAVLGTHFVETITYGIRCLGGHYSGRRPTSPHHASNRLQPTTLTSTVAPLPAYISTGYPRRPTQPGHPEHPGPLRTPTNRGRTLNFRYGHFCLAKTLPLPLHISILADLSIGVPTADTTPMSPSFRGASLFAGDQRWSDWPVTTGIPVHSGCCCRNHFWHQQG
ncbi:hypothetical protein TIFTF001_034669 [Ficus carica]|uniref:Uncharacterized protein n=1 Tax=Ficus carica TaxID=3494 RepID=A0AA88J8X4_FICCA|nr:hypothetical protein TIFTF001_034669 [Ficus carica]